MALWLGIMAALVIEAAALIVRTAFGDFTTFAPYLSDLSRVATRAIVVGCGMALAFLAPTTPFFRPAVTALAGAAFGPLACICGRAVAATLRARLGLPAQPTNPSLLVVLGFVRSLEFGALGLIAGVLSVRRARTALFAWAGTAVAMVFGVAVVAVKHEAVFGLMSTGEILAGAIEELTFPVAIALILAAVTRIIEARRVPQPIVAG